MRDRQTMLHRAAGLAFRAAGDVEPNPMVGAVLVRDGVVLGAGHHRRYGGLHAEREALADCERRGNDPRGATAYVTLEPCCHQGKQPPCTEALIAAGVARVVYARRDPHATSSGGAGVLTAAGIPCELSGASVVATRLSDPFVKRVTTGLPWVIAKWAQTDDGLMTTPEGESPWISNEHSVRRVHRLRARVDAIVTGMGTVLADDPVLTARGVGRVRRVARRVVVAGGRGLPGDCRLVRSAPDNPVLVAVAQGARTPRDVRDGSSPSRERGDTGGSGAGGGCDPSLARGALHKGRDPSLARGALHRGRDPSLARGALHRGRDPSLARGALGGEGDPLLAQGALPGVELIGLPGEDSRVDLVALLRILAERYDATNVMLECGPKLLGSFFAAGLVDEAFVYVAPRAERPVGLDTSPDAPGSEALRLFDLVRDKQLAGDVERWYRKRPG